MWPTENIIRCQQSAGATPVDYLDWLPQLIADERGDRPCHAVHAATDTESNHDRYGSIRVVVSVADLETQHAGSNDHSRKIAARFHWHPDHDD